MVPHDARTLIQGEVDTSIVTVAALTFIIWDAIIHFGEEVEFIWMGPNSYMKFMYIFIRYFPMLVQLSVLPITAVSAPGIHFSERSCMQWLIYQGVAVQIATLAVEIIFVIRVYALYNRRKLILWSILTLFAVEVVCMITALALSIPRIEFDAKCFVVFAPKLLIAYWISSLGFQTILFSLTLLHTCKSLFREREQGSLLYIIVRDGTWAFAIISVSMLLNALSYSLSKSPLAGMFYYWGLSVSSSCGSHILLNLRRISLPTSCQTTSVLTTHFDWETRPEPLNLADRSDLSRQRKDELSTVESGFFANTLYGSTEMAVNDGETIPMKDIRIDLLLS